MMNALVPIFVSDAFQSEPSEMQFAGSQLLPKHLIPDCTSSAFQIYHNFLKHIEDCAIPVTKDVLKEEVEKQLEHYTTQANDLVAIVEENSEINEEENSPEIRKNMLIQALLLNRKALQCTEITLNQEMAATIQHQIERISTKLGDNANKQNMEHVITRECSCCGKTETHNEKLKVCGGCKRRLYCSAQCQKQDWAGHKSMCKK